MHYKLILGNQAYSSWSLRGWLLLKAFGIDFECKVVPLYTPEFDRFEADHFPSLTVPTLEVSDGAEKMQIWDSLAIAEFVHELHPDAGLWPADLVARAAARSLCAEMHSSYPALRGTMPVNVRRSYRNFKPEPDALTDIRRIEALWEWAGSRWGKSGPFLFGEFCAVDAFYAPVASRFRTYNVEMNDNTRRYVDVLLQHPATVEFYQAGSTEPWIMPHNEFDEID